MRVEGGPEGPGGLGGPGGLECPGDQKGQRYIALFTELEVKF